MATGASAGLALMTGTGAGVVFAVAFTGAVGRGGNARDGGCIGTAGDGGAAAGLGGITLGVLGVIGGRCGNAAGAMGACAGLDVNTAGAAGIVVCLAGATVGADAGAGDIDWTGVGDVTAGTRAIAGSTVTPIALPCSCFTFNQRAKLDSSRRRSTGLVM